MSEERENSNIYLTPEDRKPHEEPQNLDDNDIRPDFDDGAHRVNKEATNKAKQLTSEEIQLKKKKQNFRIFVLFIIVDVALLAYIIYLIISTFVSLIN